MGVLEKLGWKPPSSKQSGITEADTLYSDDVIKYVELFLNWFLIEVDPVFGTAM